VSYPHVLSPETMPLNVIRPNDKNCQAHWGDKMYWIPNVGDMTCDAVGNLPAPYDQQVTSLPPKRGDVIGKATNTTTTRRGAYSPAPKQNLHVDITDPTFAGTHDGTTNQERTQLLPDQTHSTSPITSTHGIDHVETGGTTSFSRFKGKAPKPQATTPGYYHQGHGQGAPPPPGNNSGRTRRRTTTWKSQSRILSSGARTRRSTTAMESQYESWRGTSTTWTRRIPNTSMASATIEPFEIPKAIRQGRHQGIPSAQTNRKIQPLV
jgi:hypothetical protein